jgi:hypothetical protein
MCYRHIIHAANHMNPAAESTDIKPFHWPTILRQNSNGGFHWLMKIEY